MIHIKQFIENEKERRQIIVDEYENGYKYRVKNDKFKSRVFHSVFKPLSDSQIDKLQNDVNSVQHANYIFPKWYRAFLKVTNGINMFMGTIVLYGEQTPMTNHSKYGLIEACLERDNPNWMAPYNLRFTNSVKLNCDLQNRWLVIGCYGYDGTQIAWDYKKNKIVAMYCLPVTISIRKLRKMTESDYEKMIICEWDTFESFFTSETDRISNIFNSIEDLAIIDEFKDNYKQQALPLSHKEHLK